MERSPAESLHRGPCPRGTPARVEPGYTGHGLAARPGISRLRACGAPLEMTWGWGAAALTPPRVRIPCEVPVQERARMSGLFGFCGGRIGILWRAARAPLRAGFRPCSRVRAKRAPPALFLHALTPPRVRIPCEVPIQERARVSGLFGFCGGRIGIRTLGTLTRSAVFKTAALNHSAIRPMNSA